jgi:hypothetical protein
MVKAATVTVSVIWLESSYYRVTKYSSTVPNLPSWQGLEIERENRNLSCSSSQNPWPDCDIEDHLIADEGGKIQIDSDPRRPAAGKVHTDLRQLQRRTWWRSFLTCASAPARRAGCGSQPQVNKSGVKGLHQGHGHPHCRLSIPQDHQITPR